MICSYTHTLIYIHLYTYTNTYTGVGVDADAYTRNLATVTYDFFVTMQYNVQQDLNFSLSIDQAEAQGTPNFTIPQCTLYSGDSYQVQIHTHR
jgi:hypothetical protein